MRKLFIIAIALSASACASMNYEPPAGGSDKTLEQQAAMCRIYSRSGTRAFAAFGSPSYVAGAQLGNAIGNAIITAQNYKDCMLASGWREVRPSVVRDAAPAVTTTSVEK